MKLEKKQAEYEFLKLKRQEFQQKMDNLQRDLDHLQTNPAPGEISNQSEPTTPPDLLENGFSTKLGRANRFSTSSLVFPPSILNLKRTSSQLTSPPAESERERAYQALTAGQPSQSIPDSRRGSDEEEDRYSSQVPKFGRRAGAS